MLIGSRFKVQRFQMRQAAQGIDQDSACVPSAVAENKISTPHPKSITKV
jgi:hypothetical protein